MFSLQDLKYLSYIPKSREVVRISTSIWSDKNGIYCKKSITQQKRKSFGFQCLQEDIAMIGAEAYNSIININECKDGLYQVITINASRDYETGIIDSYELKLIPFEEKENE